MLNLFILKNKLNRFLKVEVLRLCVCKALNDEKNLNGSLNNTNFRAIDR